VANNPGIWMDHCHTLPHAGKGLVAHLMYEGSRRRSRWGQATNPSSVSRQQLGDDRQETPHETKSVTARHLSPGCHRLPRASMDGATRTKYDGRDRVVLQAFRASLALTTDAGRAVRPGHPLRCRSRPSRCQRSS
jgi:hypothetical protein